MKRLQKCKNIVEAKHLQLIKRTYWDIYQNSLSKEIRYKELIHEAELFRRAALLHRHFVAWYKYGLYSKTIKSAFLIVSNKNKMLKIKQYFEVWETNRLTKIKIETAVH